MSLTPAERIINTINDAVAIAGLEMLKNPELMRYETSNERQMLKRVAKRKFKVRVIRRVLKADLAMTQKAMKALRDYQTIIDHGRYCDTINKLVFKVPDSNFLPAVEKLQKVFQKVGFADHVRMMSESIQAAADMDAAQFGKQNLGAAA